MADVGRPTKLTPEVRKKMEEAAALDASVGEICFYAGITKDTYYRWMRENPELSDRIAELREKPILAARQTIVRAVAKDPNHAFRYVEKKRPKEFQTTTKLEHSGSLETTIPPEQARSAAADALRERYEVELRATIVQGQKPTSTGKQEPNSTISGVDIGTNLTGTEITGQSGMLSI